MQICSSILMVRPASFGFNPETALSNAFQHFLPGYLPEEIQQRALAEFDGFVALLRENGIRVVVVEDILSPPKPDAIFPNNWFSLHHNGTVVLYPMQASNRRLERRQDIIDLLRQDFEVRQVIDLSVYEQENRYLEGTGSMILDHEHRLAYACLSPRTDLGLFQQFGERFNFRCLWFHAYDHSGGLVYHTNVMMCLGQGFAVLCTEAIRDKAEKAAVLASLTRTGHEIMEITLDQVRHFAGNMLEVQNAAGQHFVIMSAQAYEALRPEQVQTLEKYARILAPPLYTIEHIGGGSARCMIAEIFLPPRS